MFGFQVRDVERQTEHVLEADELVSPLAQHLRDDRIAEGGELDLERRVPKRERFLDHLEVSRERQVPEAKPGQLVRRRAGARVHGDPAGNRRDDNLAAPKPRRRGPGELHEHRALRPFDSGRERGGGEHDRGQLIGQGQH